VILSRTSNWIKKTLLEASIERKPKISQAVEISLTGLSEPYPTVRLKIGGKLTAPGKRNKRI